MDPSPSHNLPPATPPSPVSSPQPPTSLISTPLLSPLSSSRVTSPISPPGFPHPSPQPETSHPPMDPLTTLSIPPQPLKSALADNHPSPTPISPPLSLSPLLTLPKIPGDRSALSVFDVDTKPPTAFTWPSLLANSDRLATLQPWSYLRSRLQPDPEPPPFHNQNLTGAVYICLIFFNF